MRNMGFRLAAGSVKTALEQLADLFMDGRKSQRADSEVEKDALYEEIGRLKVELDWL